MWSLGHKTECCNLAPLSSPSDLHLLASESSTHQLPPCTVSSSCHLSKARPHPRLPAPPQPSFRSDSSEAPLRARPKLDSQPSSRFPGSPCARAARTDCPPPGQGCMRESRPPGPSHSRRAYLLARPTFLHLAQRPSTPFTFLPFYLLPPRVRPATSTRGQSH